MTLDDYQKLVDKLIIERGFDDETAEDGFLLLVEEVGELAKALRKDNDRLGIGSHSKEQDLEEEIADVFWLLLALCNRKGVNLAAAFEKKEQLNAQRFADGIYNSEQ